MPMFNENPLATQLLTRERQIWGPALDITVHMSSPIFRNTNHLQHDRPTNLRDMSRLLLPVKNKAIRVL